MSKQAVELQPLSVASRRVAFELRGLQDRIERLEDTLEALYQHPQIELDGHSIGTLQDVDFLMQSVTALSDYLDKLSTSTSQDGQVCVADAISAIPLKDMAARLRGHPAKQAAENKAELF